MSDNEEHGSTVTIKFGKDFDAPWYVARGSEADQRQQLVTTFGFDPEVAAEWSLASLIVQCASAAQAEYAVVRGLGAKPARTFKSKTASKPSEEAVSAPETTSEATPNEDTGAGVEAGTEAPAASSEPEGPNPLLAEIGDAISVEALKKVWARNREEFAANPDLMTAYKARGKELKATAK